MYQHAAEFFDEHGEHGKADRERELANREARDGKTDPREPVTSMKSHHLIRRSMEPVRPVLRNPELQVSVLQGVQDGRHGPALSSKSVRKL